MLVTADGSRAAAEKGEHETLYPADAHDLHSAFLIPGKKTPIPVFSHGKNAPQLPTN